MTCCRSLGGRRVAPQSDLECERLPEKKVGFSAGVVPSRVTTKIDTTYRC
jgi:hypothetical protein